MVLISAGAGFGKTSLVADWLHQAFTASKGSIQSSQIAWFSIDSHDNELSRFLVHLVAALRNIDSKLGESMIPMVQVPQPPPLDSGLTDLINQISTFLDESVRAFRGSHRYILDYLTEEVLQRQPGERQEFLLRTSILNRMNGPLCEAVSEQAGGAENARRTGAGQPARDPPG